MSSSSTEVLSLLRRVDGACLEFEDEWKRGRRPDLEAFLADFLEEGRAELLPELLLLEWTYRSANGESFSFEEYGGRFPWRSVVEQAWGRWQERLYRSPSTVAPAANRAGRDRPRGDTVALGLPGYEQVEHLGRGGMGDVFRAFDPVLKRWVALKQVRVDQAGPGRLARFRLEAQALATLTHPHIVKVYEYAERDGQPVLVMEYVAGGTLEGRLKQAPLAPAEAARLVAILAWAVHHAHQNGIVHRDLKPANVLLGGVVAGDPGNVLGGYPKVSDFGLAALASPGLQPGGAGQTLSGAVLGTPAYMAPEQAAGKTREVGPKADVWALGVILYRCLTGVLPFVGDSVLDTLERIKTVQLRPVREESPGVPEDLAEVCMACLRKVPGERPTAAELAARLDALAGGTAPGEETGVWQRPRRPRVWWAVGAGLAAASVLALGVWLGRRGPGPGKGAEARPAEVAALRVKSIEVVQWEVRPGKTVPVGVLGTDVFEVPFDGRVTVDVELSEPGHAYLLALNADGREQLLWPVNAAGKPDRTVAPPRRQSFRYPARKAARGKAFVFRLDDEPEGGLQAFAVVASRRPLPAYEERKKQHGKAAWRRLRAEGVWCADRTGTHPVLGGKVELRGREEEVAGMPPLEEVVKSLGRGEAVMVWAFPVGKKGD
jgi:hypothetical protein